MRDEIEGVRLGGGGGAEGVGVGDIMADSGGDRSVEMVGPSENVGGLLGGVSLRMSPWCRGGGGGGGFLLGEVLCSSNVASDDCSSFVGLAE